MDTNAFAKYLTLDVIVNQKWIHACQIDAEMVQNVPLRQITWISVVHVTILDTQVDYAMKTSMNAQSHHLVAMVQPAKIQMARTIASVHVVMKDMIVQLIPMTAPLIHAKMEELALMELEITPACVLMDLKESIAKQISMNACQILAKMEQLVINM